MSTCIKYAIGWPISSPDTLNSAKTPHFLDETSGSSRQSVGWLPQDPEALESWIKRKAESDASVDRHIHPFHPVIQEFCDLIEGDPAIYMGFHETFDQIPTIPPYDRDGFGQTQVRDYMTMLSLFNNIISQAPSYLENNEIVGCPITAILTWPMQTIAGYATFINPKVNAQFGKVLDAWGAYLASPASRSVLHAGPGGWFSATAQHDMGDITQLFVCDPAAPYYGFKSWDDFFIREFRPGVRPIDSPNDDLVINTACESDAYCIAYNVNLFDKFWLKGQTYSLTHMLHNDPLAPQFIGGTVYQAFLSAFSYHRWHSPVNGKIIKIVKVPGTYYVLSPIHGFANPDGPDPTGGNLSQGFMTEMAARVLIFIQADSPHIGLMCFMAVGMVEVSTSEVTVKEGGTVKKGEQLGMFHFGGSTYCLIFRSETKVEFHVQPATSSSSLGSKPSHTQLNSKLATVKLLCAD